MSDRQTRLAASFCDEFMVDLEKMIAGHKDYVSTGFAALDALNPTSLSMKDLIIIAGRSASGKTTFGVQMYENVEAQGVTPILFSLEMPVQQLILRSVCRRSGVSRRKIKTEAPSLTSDELMRISKASHELSAKKLWMNGTSRTIEEIVSESKRMASEIRERGEVLGPIFIDYLQYIRTSTRHSDKAEEVGYITKSLKGLAKEMDVAVVAFAQVNRAADSRPNKRPVMTDISDSSAIEKEADLILFIYRDEMYNADSADKGIAEIIIGKNRHDAWGSVRLGFNGSFYNLNTEVSSSNAYKKASKGGSDGWKWR